MAHFIRRGQANFNSRFHAAVHSSHTKPRPDFRDSPLVRASRAAALAHDAERALARVPLATAAGYDRSAIMRVALAEAREVRGRGSLKPWRVLISSALRMAWLRAKLARSLVLSLATAN
jgi:hypothetical protein